MNIHGWVRTSSTATVYKTSTLLYCLYFYLDTVTVSPHLPVRSLGNGVRFHSDRSLEHDEKRTDIGPVSRRRFLRVVSFPVEVFSLGTRLQLLLRTSVSSSFHSHQPGYRDHCKVCCTQYSELGVREHNWI